MQTKKIIDNKVLLQWTWHSFLFYWVFSNFFLQFITEDKTNKCFASLRQFTVSLIALGTWQDLKFFEKLLIHISQFTFSFLSFFPPICHIIQLSNGPDCEVCLTVCLLLSFDGLTQKKTENCFSRFRFTPSLASSSHTLKGKSSRKNSNT